MKKFNGEDFDVSDFVMNDTIGDVSDGYHTFNELYKHRIILYLSLITYLNMLPTYDVWWSDVHYNDEVWDGWLIVGVVNNETNEQISYHINDSYKYVLENNSIKKLEKGIEWDGHTSDDVLARLEKWILY